LAEKFVDGAKDTLSKEESTNESRSRALEILTALLPLLKLLGKPGSDLLHKASDIVGVWKEKAKLADVLCLKGFQVSTKEDMLTVYEKCAAGQNLHRSKDFVEIHGVASYHETGRGIARGIFHISKCS
jgi:hypothetical protein